MIPTGFNVRPPWPNLPIRTLSGGNIQRAVLARELADDVTVLVAANPCFGLDFKSAAEIRSRIMQARNEGAAVLLVSEDLDEILELADRVLVISDGKIVYETFDRFQADRQTIGHYMAGHAADTVDPARAGRDLSLRVCQGPVRQAEPTSVFPNADHRRPALRLPL